MNKCIKFLDHHPRIKQWLWFIGLSLLGLLSVMILVYGLKIVMNVIYRF